MSVVTKGYQFFILVLVFITLSACSTTAQDEGYKGIYSGTVSTEQSLDVPPDLVSPDSSSAMSIPGLSNTGTSFSEYSTSGAGSSSNVLPASSSGVRFVRDGDMFWLQINAKPEEIWGQVRTFFKDLGFSFVTESPVNGLLETNWLENRFDVPTGWIASMLGGLFSTGLMDKYRIRIERTDKKGVSLLFITHQGLKEQASGDYYGDTDLSIQWVPRQPDPELEAEMLQRFLIFRGIAKKRAKQIVSKNKSIERAKLVKDKTTDSYIIEVAEIFPRTWRRISIALDRMGIIIEDRNRSKGLYYIKTTEDFIKNGTEDKGWFASIFSSNDKPLKVAEFRLSVEDLENRSVIRLMDADGEQDKSKTGYFILKKLKEHLR